MTGPASPLLSRKRRRRLGLLLLVVSLALAAVAWYPLAAEVRLRRAIAQADRLDPRWRLADIEADRAAVPDGDNGALLVMAAESKLPPNGNTAWPYGKAFGDCKPNVMMTDRQTAALRDYLKLVAPTLHEARKLADRPRGRWPAGGTRLDAQSVARVLYADVHLRAHEGELDGALNSCRALLNVGRSVGDDPNLMAQLVRIAAGRMAVDQAQYVLGHGEPSEGALAALQKLMAEEAEEPLLTIALRGERANYDHRLESLQHGDTSVRQMVASTRGPLAPKPWVSKEDLLYLPGVTTNSRAAVLERMNRLVEITKLAPQEQAGALEAFTASRPDEPLVVRLISAEGLVRYALDCSEGQGFLRCAAVALAVERYRRANGRWPESLAQLKDAYLREVPPDPLSGQPLRYQKDDEGVLISAAWPADKRRTEYRFRLWDVAKRRRPPPGPATPQADARQ